MYAYIHTYLRYSTWTTLLTRYCFGGPEPATELHSFNNVALDFQPLRSLSWPQSSKDVGPLIFTLPAFRTRYTIRPGFAVVMTEALPKGLVTNSEAISRDIENIDHVVIEDIAQLWRGSFHISRAGICPTADPRPCRLVYTTNRDVFSDLVGVRLEYLFWRIWSSPRIYRNIRGSTVSREFSRISEGPTFLRTTPTQSPTSGKGLLDDRPVRDISYLHRTWSHCIAFPV